MRSRTYMEGNNQKENLSFTSKHVGRVVVLIVLAANALGGCAPAALSLAAPAPTPTPLPSCPADSIPDFADFLNWSKVNPKPIQGHEMAVNIYVNDQAKSTYLSGSGVFPECAKIVKTHLADKESESITAITVMVKMASGYDPEHNDWWWGMYDKDGKVAEMSGKVQVCIECHQPVAAADYVFSQAVLAESQK